MPSRLAIHETGHVAIALSQGVEIAFVEVAGDRPIPASGGMPEAGGRFQPMADYDDPIVDLAVSLGGIEAEFEFLPDDEVNKKASADDLRYCANAYEKAFRKPAPANLLADQRLLEMRADIRMVFARCRDDFLAFASELDRRKRINGTDCKRMLRSAFCPMSREEKQLRAWASDSFAAAKKPEQREHFMAAIGLAGEIICWQAARIGIQYATMAGGGEVVLNETGFNSHKVYRSRAHGTAQAVFLYGDTSEPTDSEHRAIDANAVAVLRLAKALMTATTTLNANQLFKIARGE